MIILVLLAQLTGAAAPALAPPAFTYHFDEVKSRVYRYPKGDEKNELRVEAKQTADAGDIVRTNWLGRAVVAVPERASRFEISSSTRVRLAGKEPGVLLVLNQGKVKAFFDALTGGEAVERRVATPGALLAVRGTRYGADVDGGGQTSLAVFEGTVEVIPTDPATKPFLVTKDQFCTFKPGAPPRIVPMGSMGMTESSWQNHSSMGSMSQGRGSDGTGMMPGSSGTTGGSMHGSTPMGPKR